LVIGVSQSRTGNKMSIYVELLEVLLADQEMSLLILFVAVGFFLKLFLGGIGDLLRGRKS